MIDDSGPYPLAINRSAGNPALGFLGPPKSSKKSRYPDKPIPTLEDLSNPKSSNQSRIPPQNMKFPDESDLSSKSIDDLREIKRRYIEAKKIVQKKIHTEEITQAEEDRLNELVDAYDEEVQDIEDKILEIRASGTGLKKRRGRPKGSGISFKDNIDHAKGIQPVKKYHPFGKYFVNSHKLNNGNVLSIKSKSGTNVREYPSRTVSQHLGNVIKTIIGGGVPSYNDMEKLSNDEKDYLYKISKRAEFADKISIPTPSKDQQEKDIHEFEVCKGEIMAGNDSKELIKKFKLLIIKLSKNGTIPKREASEVMTELLELGY